MTHDEDWNICYIQGMDEFLATLSHEIRTPLNGVLAMADLLLETKLTDDQRDFANTIKSSGRSLLTFVNDVLDLSKIESGKMDLETIEFALSPLLTSLERSLGYQAKGKGIGFFISVPSGLEQIVLKGDPNRITQILNNLLGNALKFTQNGHVALEVSLKEKSQQCTELTFEIIDTGIGISADVMARLFQSFQQSDASISRRYGGSGLGLSICKKLVTLMNGSIEAYSREKTGSTFLVKLPLEQVRPRV